MSHQLFKITQNLILKNNEGGVLILKDPRGKWLLPGGRVNAGENWLDALKREVKEETGINNFEISKIIDVDNWTEDGDSFYVVTFTASVSKLDEIKLSEEHTEFLWVTASDLDNYTFWHYKIKERINKSFIQNKNLTNQPIDNKQQPVPSIKIILKHQDKIMMLKLKEDDKIVYDLPGGRMEYGEGIFETLKREVKEEIGVNIEFETEPKLLRVNDYLHSRDKIHRLLVNFVYEVPDLIEKAEGRGEPNTETIWLTQEELSQLDINPNYRKMLLSTLEK